LDKRYQRADWGRRPLSSEQLAYAAADTAFLIALAVRLRTRLEKLGRWTWAGEEFRRLERVRHQPEKPDPLAFERIKGARSLRGDARDRLHELYAWRDDEARKRDLPPFKVLGNRQMLVLAQQPPADLKQLTQVEGLGSRFARRWGREIVRRLQRPRGAPPRPVGERRRSASAEIRRRMQRLLDARDRTAARLDLQPGLICPKALVEAVAEKPDILDAAEGSDFTGWRLEVLGEPFKHALRES
jgi:ribonuclease D